MSIRIRLGREVELWNGTSRIHLRTRHERGILANLALNASMPVSRVRLAHDHWPDSSREAALLNLRQRLLWLRRALDGALESDRDWVWLNPNLVQIEVPDHAADCLVDLPFPWVERYRRGYFPASDPVSAERIAVPIRLIEVQDWVQAWVFEGETAAFPFADRFDDLKRKAGRAEPGSEEQAYWTVAAAGAGQLVGDRAFALEAGLRHMAEWAQDPARMPLAAQLGELAANTAHRSGDFHLCLAFIAEAEQHYQSLKVAANALRMRFKYYRVSLDLGLASAGERALAELHEKYRRKLTPHARALLDDNLIFAHANNGNIELASEALARARAREDGSPLIEENAAVMFLEAGDLRAAADCLLRANAATFDPAKLAMSALVWQRSVEVLSHSGLIEGCAMANYLLNADSLATGQSLTVMNRLRLNRAINRALSDHSGARWISATRSAGTVNPIEGHEQVVEALRRTAAHG